MAKKLTEPRRTPEEIRARVMRMLTGAYARGATATAAELERLLRYIDGRPEDAWDDDAHPTLR